MVKQSLVRIANKATVDEISAVAGISSDTLTVNDARFVLEVRTAAQLSKSSRDEIWKLYEPNMRTLVTPSSFGWHPRNKKKELFHEDSRFILVLYTGDAAAEDEDDEHEEPSTLAAFTMFRFDDEDDENVVYCYELQVSPQFRTFGLGTLLLQKLSLIGKRWGMEKIMLTVLKANTLACKFYDKVGFNMDPASPDYPDSDAEEGDSGQADVDYYIMSRSVA